MKTRIISLSTLAVAALALSSCVNIGVEVLEEENNAKVNEGVPFEITVDTDATKTANDGNATNWVAGDKINLFHAVTGGNSYVYDGAFETSSSGASVKFGGTLAAELDGGTNYDWYALYPYVDNGYNTPAEFQYVTIGSVAGDYQVQSGNDSKAHLAGQYFPLYAKKTNLAAATKPTLSMKQMASVLAVKVTNKIASDIIVESITVTCSGISDGLVGEYQVDFSGATPVYTSSTVNNTAKLNVSGGSALANGETGTFYLAVKPFTAPAGQKITIVVTTDQGTQTSVSNALGADFTFYAGKIHDLNFNFTNKSLSAAEFKYNDTDWLTAQSIALPAPSAGQPLTSTTQTVSPISITSTNGSTPTRVFNSGGNYTLRVYAGGGSITLSTTGTNLISKIAFTGSDFGANVVNVTASCGAVSGNTANLIWNGLTQDVTFTANSNFIIETITVFYQAATESDHVVTIPVKTKNVAYDATSATFDVKTVNVSDITAVGTTGFSSFAFEDDVLTVNITANESSDPRDITVTVTSATAGSNDILTITQAGAPTLISSLTSSSTGFTVNGQVKALTSNKGYIIEDASAAIFVYTGAAPTVSLGQTVAVSGTVSVYNKGLQITSPDVTPGATESPSYDTPTSYGLTEVTTWNEDGNDRLAQYVTITGVAKSSYDFIVGGGSTANATTYYAAAGVGTMSAGDYVTVTGYAINVMTGPSRLGIVPTSITKDSTKPALIFDDITGVSGEGVASTDHTITPYRVSGWTPSLVSKPSWVSTATPAADCTKLTYVVEENDATERSGNIVIRLTKDEVSFDYTIQITQEANLPKTTFTFSTIYSSCTTNCNIDTDTQDGITLTYNKNSGTQPKYYNTGKAIRLYNLNTLEVSGGLKKIKKVVFAFGSDKGNWSVSSGGGTLEGSGSATMTWAASSDVTSVVFGTTATARINTITVTYQD